jgi:hypothetical protein
MRRKIWALVATFAAFALCLALFTVTMAYAQMPAGLNRPAGVPEGYVVTPFGYFHPSCVEHLAEGDTLLVDKRMIQHADGTLTNIMACDYPHYTARGEVIVADTRMEPPAIGHSWIVDAETTTATSYGEISATWTVPPDPIYYDSQKVIFFPGLEDINDVVTILQPVLNWNNDFTEAWSIASWNCCVSGKANESSPVHVYKGDTILGTVKSTCSAGTLSCPTWNVTTLDQTLGKSTALNSTSSYGQTFNWAFAGALEVYYIASCYDYPPTQAQSQTFNVTLYDDNFNVISNPGWYINNRSSGLTPQCNYGGTVSPTQVTLDYGTAGGQPWRFSASSPPYGSCPYPGTWSFSLTQVANSNYLLWDASVTTNETSTLSVSWTLSDNDGALASGSTGFYTAPRPPVGTPTLSINASILQSLTGCDDRFQANFTGGH